VAVGQGQDDQDRDQIRSQPLGYEQADRDHQDGQEDRLLRRDLRHRPV
jgi:hypothetical protein